MTLFTVIASASAIVGVVVICAVFLIVLIVVFRTLYIKSAPCNSKQDTDVHANSDFSPGHSLPDDEYKEAFPDYAEPDIIRSQDGSRPSANETTVVFPPDENQLDPVYYAIFQGRELTDESTYKMDKNSSYALVSGQKQENFYYEIGEAFVLRNNCAYGQHQEPKSPPETE